MANPNIRKNQLHVIHLGAKKNMKYNRDDLINDASDIPTLVPASVIKEWNIGPDSYFKIQVIEFPIKANGYHYDNSFAHSYVKAIETAPMPGSKDGHEMAYGKRGKTDLLLVGGKVVEGENGTALMYLKNFIPPKADTDNTNFIKECKSNMIHFSLVTYSRDVLVTDEKGNQEWHVVEHMTGGRNDAVDRGTGAMDQRTNSQKPKIESEKPAVGGEDINPKEQTIMTEQELLDAIKKNANNNLVRPQMLAALSVDTVTDKHVNALKMSDAFTALGVANPVEAYTALQAEKKLNAESVHAAKLNKEFGESSKEKPNLLRDYAARIIPVCEEKEFDTKVNAFRLDPIAVKFAADNANTFSERNALGEVIPGEKKNNQETIPGSHRVDVV